MVERAGISVVLFVAVACASAVDAQTPRSPSDPPEKSELASPVVDVPLTKDGAFYFLNVLVNGHPLRFTVETGANFVAIGQRAARAVELPVDTIRPGVGRDSLVPIARIAHLQLGGARLTGLTARVTPLFDNAGFDGIISLPALHDLMATFDFPNRRLRLQKGQLPNPNGRDVLLALDDRGGRVQIPIKVAEYDAAAVIDTRSDLPIMLPDSVASRLKLANQPLPAGEARGPSLGIFQMRGARLDGNIRIGALTLERPPLIFRNRPGIVLGIPVLQQLAITLDQINHRVRIVKADGPSIVVPRMAWETNNQSSASRVPGSGAPAPSVNAALPGPPAMGFHLAGAPGGALFVVDLVPGSDAEKAGLRNGDQLVELDGISADSMTPDAFHKAAQRGSRVRVVVTRDGKRMDLEILPSSPHK